MLSEPKLAPSMSNSNRYKSHSKGSDRHSHEPVQTIPHSLQGKRLGNVATNTPRSDELMEHPQKGPQRGGNSQILQWMESNIIQTSNQKDQGVSFKKEGGNQGRSPKPTHLHKKRRITRKQTAENHIPQVTGFQKSKKIPWKMSSTWPEP
ncbi:hypothetical protein O181_057174 [Austropuccinia psidii MF-1]|uniref:Uncharacterized protein n=1 Tax=Austropuccinia psidii MF-1 TaxID=1389203 RepID=A0A9Q3EA09_9BASI|nr:hypothetical protein [Austropuccinia psidii MF-1]